MKFNNWIKQSGLTMAALARMCNLSKVTIKNLVDGKRPHFKTVKKIMRKTKDMTPPVTLEMWTKIKAYKKKK